MLTDKILIRIY